MSGNRLAAQSWGIFVGLGQYSERFILNEASHVFTIMIRQGRRDTQLQS